MTAAELLARLAQRPPRPIDFKDFGFGADAYQDYCAIALRGRAEFDRALLLDAVTHTYQARSAWQEASPENLWSARDELAAAKEALETIVTELRSNP